MLLIYVSLEARTPIHTSHTAHLFPTYLLSPTPTLHTYIGHDPTARSPDRSGQGGRLPGD